MTPEQKARELIDDQLQQTGWSVQSADEMDITAARGVAVSEFALDTGFADYLLYGDCKAIGTIEAEPEGYTLNSPEDSDDLPDPNVFAQEIVDDMQTALEQFSAVSEGLNG
jgi:hypothetical protein